MGPRQLFALHVLLLATFPVVVAARNSPLATTLLHAYLAIVLVLGGFVGKLYVFPLNQTVTISGGALAYGALMFTALILFLTVRDIQVIRDIVKLVIAVNVFKLAFFVLITRSMESPATLNPLGTSPDVFNSSIKVVTIGGFAIILELLLLVTAFEYIKPGRGTSAQPTAPTASAVHSAWYLVAFVAVLGLDGILFPTLSNPTSPELSHLVRVGVEGKLLVAAAYAIPLAAFLFFFRSTVELYEAKPLHMGTLLHSPGHVLIKEIHRQQEVLDYQAAHDGMTGLVNRAMLLDRLDADGQPLEPGGRRRDPTVVLVLDLDNFRLVNDRL
ncbi:MAG: GGDEF domain-containing protein, partial [Aquihabitans sp.]